MGFAEEIYRLGEVNLFTSNFVIGDAELDRISTKTETIEIEVLHKWLDFRYYFMELNGDWAEGGYYSYKRRCIYFLEIVELENFKAITEGLYQSYSKEFPYSKKKDFIKLMFGNTISFLKRFLKLDLIRIGEIEFGNESEYIFYMDADDINTEFSDFVIKSKYDIQHYRQYYKTVLKYLKFFKNDNTKLAIPPHPIVKQKEIEETPKTFEELFYNTDLVTPSIDILKEIEPPLIDTEYNYIGKLKGIICVWIDELKRQGIVKSNYPEERKLFAALIPQKIKRFSIDESMFGKYQQKAEDNYRTDIKTKISKIKLSQNSH